MLQVKDLSDQLTISVKCSFFLKFAYKLLQQHAYELMWDSPYVLVGQIVEQKIKVKFSHTRYRALGPELAGDFLSRR